MARPENQETLATPELDERRRDDAGMALVSTILIMMLMSALLVGFFSIIAADQQASGINRDQTQAYAAAHAGLEKLTADLGAMFTGGNYSPTSAQIAALTAAPPSLPGFEYVAATGGSGYTIASGAATAGDDFEGAVPGHDGIDHEIHHQRDRPGRRRGWVAAPKSTCAGNSRRSPCRCSSSGCSPRTT